MPDYLELNNLFVLADQDGDGRANWNNTTTYPSVSKLPEGIYYVKVQIG